MNDHRPGKDRSPVPDETTEASASGPVTILWKVSAWLLLAALLAAGFGIWNVHRYEFDDAYISYRYSANLAAGDGLVFNPGERVEGFSNLLWVLILASAAVLDIQPHLVAPWLGVGAYLATLVLCWAFLTRRYGAPKSAFFAATSTAVLVTAHGVAATAGNGLETHFFALLVLIGGLALTSADLQRAPSLIRLGLVPVLLLLTRPDGVLPAAALLLVVALRSAAERSDWRIGLLSGAIAATPVLVAGTILAAFKLSTFGALLPNPYHAKAAGGFHLDAGFAYLWAFARSYPFTLVCIALLVMVIVLRSPNEKVLRLAFYALVTSISYGAFLAKVGGDFMEYRLALQIVPVLLLAGAAAASELSTNHWVRGSVTALLLGLSLFPPVPEPVYYMQNLAEMNRYAEEGTRVGLALASLPPETRVATTLIGTIGYYSDLHIIDQWGLVDPDVRHRRARPRFVRGHARFTNRREARRLGAHLYLDHPHLCTCDPACIRDHHQILIATGPQECVRALVLSPEPWLVEVLSSDPERYPVLGPGIH